MGTHLSSDTVVGYALTMFSGCVWHCTDTGHCLTASVIQIILHAGMIKGSYF